MTTVSSSPIEKQEARRSALKAYVPLGAVLVVATVLRLVDLGERDFWHDEVHNLIKSDHIERVILEGDLVSNHPPLFTILLTLWRSTGIPADEHSMRLLPVLLGVCGVGAAFALGRRLYSTRAGLYGAFLLAVSPLFIHHSQDLKTYILLPFTGTLACYSLYRAAWSNESRHWVLYAVWAAAACYSDLFAAPLLVSANVWYLLRKGNRWTDLRRWALANLAGAVLFLPQLGIMLTKFNTVISNPAHWWVPEPSLQSLAFYLKAVAFGYSDSDPAFKIAMLLFALFGTVGLWAALRRDVSRTMFLVMWTAGSIGIVAVLSLWTGQSIFLIRAMLAYAVPVYIVVGLGLSLMPARPLRYAGLLLFAAVAGVSLAQQYRGQLPVEEFPHRPGIHAPVGYRALTDHIIENWHEGDVVVTTGNASWLPCYWYGLRDREQVFGVVETGFAEMFNANNPRTTDRAEFDGYFPRDIHDAVAGADRVWLVFTEWERAYLKGNPMQVWRWMDAHWIEVAHETFRNVELFRYAKEEDGVPIAVVERDEDDGVNASLVYRTTSDRVYGKIAPDLAPVQQDPAERRGDALLRFADAVGAETVDPARTEPARSVSFEVQHYGDAPMTGRVEVHATGESPSSATEIWRQNFDISAGETRAWAFTIDAKARRVDVWMYAPTGGAHHIFRRFE